jgi:hypothetical protein
MMPGTRCTIAMEAADASAQGAHTPSKESPTPHPATRRRGEVASATPHHRSSAGAPLDPPLNDQDPIVLTIDPSPEPTRTPPVAGSPPSFRGEEEPGGRGKWLVVALITPAHTGCEVLRRWQAVEEMGWVTAAGG